jgi:Protein of unknown function (DUF3592)
VLPSILQSLGYPLNAEAIVDLSSGIAAWLDNNQPQISRCVRRYLPLVQILTGIFLAFLGYAIGKDHLHLIRHGVRTYGVVVGYQAQSFYDSRHNSSTGFMPLVEFRAGDRLVHFKDWLGSSSHGARGTSVAVLYDPDNPSTAVIDRAFLNWIPWGPTLALGVFLILVGFRSIAVRRTADSLNPTPVGF